MNINFKAVEVEYDEAMGGEIVCISFDEDPNDYSFNRTKRCISISQNYEFPGKPTLQWHDGEDYGGDYSGGTGIKSYNLSKDLFELELTNGLSFNISHSCSNKVLVKIQRFLKHEFGNANKKA